MAPLPLGLQDSITSIKKYAKLWHGAPFVTWAEGLNTETVGEDLFFWTKTELNLSKDLFLFWSSPNFGFWSEKRTWFWVGKFSFWSSLISNFLPFPHPLSKILCRILGVIIIKLPPVCVYCVVGVASLIIIPYTAALIGEAL